LITGKSGTGDSDNINSDKRESDAAAKNAHKTSQSPTEKDDDTQHGGKANSSKLDNTNVDSGENNNTGGSVNDNGSGTHDNDNKGGTQHSDKEPHETTGQAGRTDKKENSYHKMCNNNLQQEAEGRIALLK